MTKTYVDGMLLDWGSRIFNSSPVKVTSAKKGMTGFPLSRPAQAKKGGAVMHDAKVIRSKLGSISKRTPEVMVKISGGGKGMSHIKAHIDYISRHGKLEAEDQNGDKLHGKDDISSLKDEWQYGGFPIAEEGARREAFNIVLSMPAGTNELAVKRAARDFAASEFSDHQYVMVLHTFNTDPDPVPSPNPHVHLTVKATALDGTRLNPRKADLQRWREDFAKALREHGVEATATKRVQRNLRTQSKKTTRFKNSERQLEKRDSSPSKIVRSSLNEKRVTRAKETETHIFKAYHEITKTLANSSDVEDRKLAAGIINHLKENQQQRPVQQQPIKGVER